MRRVSTKARLTLYYAVVLTVALTVFAITLRLVTGAALLHGLDSSLLAATQLVQVDVESGAPSFAQQQDAPALGTGLIELVLLDGQGRVVGRMGPATGPLPPASRSGTSTVGRWRVLSKPVPTGTLLAYRSLDELRDTLRTLTTILLAGVPLMVLAASVAGWWLAHQALAPVSAVMATAGTIASSGDPTRRVPRRPGNDEMGRLVDLINAMLDRLETVIQRERAFANAAAHQLRTPLALIRGRAELALESSPAGDAHRAALTTIRQHTDELQGMVDSLLALARARAAPLRRTALAPILTEVLETTEALAGTKRLRLRVELHDASVLADPGLLRQAVLALVDNAVRSSPEGGTIGLRTFPTGPNIDIAIDDSGPGIEASERARLVQPFQRGAGGAHGEGTGLGLALALEVAEAHHGRLLLEDGPLGGLRARIRLPVA